MLAQRAMKVKTNAVINTSEVTLDAAQLAADLSEALQLQAEGSTSAQLLAMEAELRERQAEVMALEQASQEEAARRCEPAPARTCQLTPRPRTARRAPC